MRPNTDIVRWWTRLENVEPAMNHLSIPADRVRHIEQDGLFGTWDWDFASGPVANFFRPLCKLREKAA
jgi:hypothetical protein